MNRTGIAGEVKREAQVPQALDALDKAINEAEQAFSSLIQRTESVQRVFPEKDQADGPAKIAEAMCPLAERIRRASERVYGLSYNVTGLMSRIEL